uniref:Secreted protein n=1 Tax=Caenorhabditis japonica TaxID=281687 RepID=A0A8R1IJ68_CAEJA
MHVVFIRHAFLLLALLALAFGASHKHAECTVCLFIFNYFPVLYPIPIRFKIPAPKSCKLLCGKLLTDGYAHRLHGRPAMMMKTCGAHHITLFQTVSTTL